MAAVCEVFGVNFLLSTSHGSVWKVFQATALRVGKATESTNKDASFFLHYHDNWSHDVKEASELKRWDTSKP